MRASRLHSPHYRQLHPTTRVHLNATQYFGGATQTATSYLQISHQPSQIANTQKGRTLDYADIQHYQRIVVALHETIRLIDRTIEAKSVGL